MSHTLLKKRKNILKNTVLYDFQKELLNKINANYLIAADTGTGKTIMAIHHYVRFTKGEKLVIVVPAQKKKEGGWTRDIRFIEKQYDIKIDFEELSYGVLARKWEEYKDCFIVFDECHFVKNSTSKRGKAAIKLTQNCTHFLLLSATPSSNGWGDTVAYMIMFGHYKNKTQFEREHAIYQQMKLGTRSFQVVADYKEKDKLLELYQSFSIGLSKDEALDLPPLMFQDVNFKVAPIYNTILKDRVLYPDTDDEILFDSIPALQHGLRFNANQTDKLKYSEMLAESTNENIIFFYQYQAEKEELIKVMKKLKKEIFEVSGQKSHLPNRDDWELLNNSVTIVQYQAGSAGIELQYANLVVFYTPTYSYQDYEQSLGRAYRNGQDKKVTVYRYITDKTIEVDIYAALNNKKDFTEELFRKEVKI